MMLGWAWPDSGVPTTLKSTPASAELVPMLMVLLFDTLTLVSRPTTAEGLMRNTLPLPLLVFIPAEMDPAHFPLLTTPHKPDVAPVGIMQVWPAVVHCELLVHEAPLVLSTH